MTAGAAVTINGATIASSWDGSDLVALDGLSIRWGRERPYEDPEPSILTMSLIDRSGAFINDQNRVGQEVIVTMTDPQRVQFRGAMTKPKARRARVHNPLLNADETVWVVTITATDPLASLAMAVFAGPAQNGWVEGAGGWPEVSSQQRLQDLYNAGANGIVEGFEPTPDLAETPQVTRRLHGQAAADARTALELVRQAYHVQPLAVPGYDPDTHMVKLIQFTDSSPVALTYTDGVVRLALTTGRVVPSSKVGVSSYELESTVDSAIDVVQVSYFWYGKDPTVNAGNTSVKRVIYTEGFIEGRAARYDPRTRRVLKIESELITFDPTEFAGDVSNVNRAPGWLRDKVLAIVNKLNGQLRVPRLIFDARRAPLPADLEAILYRPVAQGVPFYFAGSVFNAMAMVGPQFQIIGGTLSYDGGWRHEVTVCATGPAQPSTLTVAQLVTNPNVALDDFDPDISLADLGHVTTGLA